MTLHIQKQIFHKNTCISESMYGSTHDCVIDFNFELKNCMLYRKKSILLTTKRYEKSNLDVIDGMNIFHSVLNNFSDLH